MEILFDTLVLGVMSLSVIMAFFRGFIKEFFTLLSWVLATIITIYATPVVTKLIEAKEGREAIYDAIAILAVFGISMFIFSFVFGRIIHHLKKSDCMFLDRSLGVLFGFIRGGLFVCLGYIFLVGFVYQKKPEWMHGSTIKVVDYMSKQLMKLNPKEFGWEIDLKEFFSSDEGENNSDSEENKVEGKGYNKNERKQIESLIERGVL